MSCTEASFTTPTSVMLSPLLFSLSYWKSIGLPRLPSLVSFFSSEMAGLNLSMNPTVSIFPEASAILISSSPSWTELVIGFSTKVLIPARRVFDATETWVAMVTPSSASLRIISSTSLYPLIPNFFA